MLEDAYFLEKTINIASASGAPPSNLRLLSAALRCYFCLLLQLCRVYFYTAKCGLLPLKKNKITTVNVLLLLLLHLFFTLNSVVFIDRWRKNISCPRAQHPSYATARYSTAVQYCTRYCPPLLISVGFYNRPARWYNVVRNNYCARDMVNK